VSAERELSRLQAAGQSWKAALDGHWQAPPAPGFQRRLQRLADAAAEQQVACNDAHGAGLGWRPLEGASSAEPPYELRADANRPGPPALWQRFDASVRSLGVALEGYSLPVIALAFGDLGQSAQAIVDALEQLDRQPAAPARTRQRAS
jgi:hypothetical protein